MKAFTNDKLQKTGKKLSNMEENNDTVAVNYHCAVFCRVEENSHNYILVDKLIYQDCITSNQYLLVSRLLQDAIYNNYTMSCKLIKDISFAETVAREVRNNGYQLHSIVDIYIYGIAKIEQNDTSIS